MIKVIAIIAVVVVVAIAAVLVLAATKPDTFQVQRAASIKAPPEKIFALINDLRGWGAWSPWEKKDPAMKRTFSGAQYGKGAVYAWDGDKNVDRLEAMKNLAMSEIMAGANFWDAPGHSMAGSNDYATRREIFSWIKQHENTFYQPRTPISPIGVYFSPQTRNPSTTKPAPRPATP